MKSRVLIFCCGLLALVRPISGAGVDEAARPLVEGVPQVAVVRLRALLKERLSEEEKRSALLKLAEALIAAGQPNESLAIFEQADLRALPTTNFLHAQALAALGRWNEALPLYEKLAAETRSPREAILGKAESLRALGRIDEALRTYGLLVRDEHWNVRAHLRSAELLLLKKDTAGAARELNSADAKSASDRKERRFLRACVEAELGNTKRSSALFASILNSPQGATHSLLVSTLLGIAEIHLQSNKPERGDDYLEEFIDHHPSDPDLSRLFAKLDQLYAAERRQARHDLPRWARDPAQPRRAFAQWYLARAELRLRQRDAALQAFEALRAEHPSLAELAPVFLENAQLFLDDGQLSAAAAAIEAAQRLTVAPDIRERIELLAARIDFAAAKFPEAAKIFQRVALTSPEHSKDALLNASLAWLQAGDDAQFAAVRDELKSNGADESTRGEANLEQALAQAAKGEKNSADSLRSFIKDFPKHPRVSEAWVALAELAFHAAPPRLDEARQNLKRAMEAQPTVLAQERADYLSIWLEEAAPAPNESKVIDLANGFLQKHGGSSSAGEVRLKLAETYYRRQDFAGAETQFTLLAQQSPNGPLTEKAQFFAAQSARQSMTAGALDRALTLFDDVVKKNGELKWAARNEQAIIERKLGKNEDALTLYEEVLKGDAKAPEKREALCGKADIFYELGATKPENYQRAAEIYSQLAAQSEVASHWRNQALCKKGMCQEKLGLRDDALATFYQVIEDGSRPDRRREFFWFYKAGFNAARLLEEKSNWQPAAAIYQKLAFAGGPRSEEAQARLKQLRLEHYLWDQ